jgi:hypothetical protein
MMRRLPKIVLDRKPEAVGNVDAAAANFRAELAKEREQLLVPAASDLVAKLPPLLFDSGPWRTHRRQGCRRDDV